MRELKNKLISAKIRLAGAELCSLFDLALEQECIWQAGKEWPKSSPLLFPIVGTLKNEQYQFKGKKYHLGRHGFARDRSFEVLEHSDDTLILALSSNEETLKLYPFEFCLKVHYRLLENKLKVKYLVTNTGKEAMYFSIGAHPAFKVPLHQSNDFEDYFLEFENEEHCGIFPLTEQGLIKAQAVPFLQHTNTLALKKNLFYKDALVFKQLKSKAISIKSKFDKSTVKVNFDGFPFLGIWSKSDANFVCIEPWQGITDTNTFEGELDQKEGILALAAQNTWQQEWSIELNP